MNVLVNDVNPDNIEYKESCHYAELTELFSKSDVIVLHCPLFPETLGIINKDTDCMKKMGYLLHNSEVLLL